MDVDVVVDDEFQARQADAAVGNLGEVEGQLRVADVHHDLQADVGHLAPAHFLDLGLDQAVVDAALVALGAGHGDLAAVGQHVGGVGAAHHGRDAQFARDDGRMAGAPAPVGDDGRGQLHDGFPVGIGHVGDQDVAGAHLVHFGGVGHDAHRARADLLADGAAGDEDLAGGLQAVAFLDVVVALLRLDGFRAGLEDVELAVHPVAAPFDVHRALVVLFDDGRVAGQLDDLVVSQGIAVAFRCGNLDRAHGVAGDALFVEFHLDQLGADAPADDRIVAGGQRGLEDVELVRVHGALDDGLAQAVGRGDEHHVLEAGFGVQGEHHARAALVRAHHALDAGRQGDLGVRVALVHAVGDRAVVVQRGEHVADLFQHVVDADHVQVGFLLAREGGVGQVLGGGRRAHGEGALAVGVELGEGGADGLLEVGRERGVDHPLADFGAGGGQFAHVVGVQRVQARVDAGIQARGLQEVAEGVGRGCEAARHANARAGQLADHFPKRSVLASYRVHIRHAELLERYDIRHGVTFEIEKACLPGVRGAGGQYPPRARHDRVRPANQPCSRFG
ncbi:hypothetical protein CDEN61S_01267 [Castellaniella denitrificans]